MPKQTHQLAAIMFTDIVGYTALMGENEDAAYQLLKKNRQVQKPILEKHHGKWLKEMGDGTLASFQTVSDAVYCAIEIQQKCKKEPDLKLRIGIHQGEVIVEDGDVFGDGVNIASRLESLAPAGGIYVSETVFRNIQNKKGIKCEFIREESLKNVKSPVRIYEVKGAVDFASDEPDQITQIKKTNQQSSRFLKIGLIGTVAFLIILLFYFMFFLRKSDVDIQNFSLDQNRKDISIAVLPFKNFSGDADKEPFCDGMTDAVISRLVKLEGISRVISMTTMMQFKNTNKSIPEIASELEVSHILEANFQKSNEQVKITLQLIDGPNDNYYWSDEFSGIWGDIFGIQASVAENVARNMGAQISMKEIEKIREAPTVNSEAYELYLQARWSSFNIWGVAPMEMQTMLEKAISLDSTFIEAYVELGYYWLSQIVWDGDPDLNYDYHIEKAKKYLQYALSLDPESGNGHIYMGGLKLYFEQEITESRKEMLIGLSLNPTPGNKQILANTILPALGETELAQSMILEAMIDAPKDPGIWSAKALNEYIDGQFDKAMETLENHMDMIRLGNNLSNAARIYYGIGDYQRVVEVLNEYLDTYPEKRPARVLGFLAAAYYHLGSMYKFENLREELLKLMAISPIGSPSYHLAILYCITGENDMAFKWLDKAIHDQEAELYWLRIEPPFKALQDDSRWQEMLDKVGFPE